MRYLAAIIALPFAVFAAPDDTAVANRKWVREFVAANASKLAEDDNLYSDGTNHWVYVLESVNGVLTNVPYYLEFKLVEETGDKHGAVVVMSDNKDIPVGTLLASCGGATTNFCNKSKRITRTLADGALMDLGYLFDAVPDAKTMTDRYGTSRLFSLTNYTEYIVGGVKRASREYTSAFTLESSFFLDVVETITFFNPSGQPDGRQERYSYRIKGTLMPDSLFRETAGGEKTNVTWSWCEASGDRTTRQYMMVRPKSVTSVFEPSLLDIFLPRAYAASQVVSYSGEVPYLMRKPKIDTWVDSFAFAMNGETKETHYAEPEAVESRAEWYEEMRWFSTYPDSPFESPYSMVLKVDIYNAAGVLLYKGKSTKIRSLEQLKSVLGVESLVTCDPTFPRFVEKIDYCAEGQHIFGADCKCIKCDATRAHAFGFDHVSDGECARCINRYDDYTEDSRGEKVPNGKQKDEYCDAVNTTDGNLSLHTGWQDVDHESDEDFYCCCQCGFYSSADNKDHLPHDFGEQEAELDADAGTVWTDRGDGIHHYAEIECLRTCGAKKTIEREHTPDIETPLPEGEERTYEEVGGEDNAYYHKVKAKCSANGCAFLGWIKEPHDFSDSEKPCYCVKCKKEFHIYNEYPCGRYSNTYCARCEMPIPDKERFHEFGYALPKNDPEYDTHHICECGAELEKHIVENGRCTVCEWKSEEGKRHKCAYHRRSKEKGGGGADVSCHDPEITRTHEHTQNPCTDEDCKGNLKDDKPHLMPSAYENCEIYHLTSFTHSGELQCIKGHAYTFDAGVADANAVLEGFFGTWTGNRAFIGLSFTQTFMFAPTTNRVVNSFMALTPTVNTVRFESSTYSGVVTEDGETIYVEWD